MNTLLEIEKSDIRPVLKWAGNKAQTPIAERVKQLYQPFRNTHLWVEPFVGVGGMLLDVNPDRALCCDLSAEVIGLHRWIRDGGKCHPFPEIYTAEDYYQQRLKFQGMQCEYNASPDFVDEDHFFSLMIWLNKAGFNGLWRVNQNGDFNVPVGKNSKGDLHTPATPELEALQRSYKSNWNFINSDFENIEAYNVAMSPCFVYADPPYFGTHATYTAKPFTWDDQKRLAHWLANLNCPVVASNSNHPEIVELYKNLGFRIELISVKRSISCNGDRTPATEMLAVKGVRQP